MLPPDGVYWNPSGKIDKTLAKKNALQLEEEWVMYAHAMFTNTIEARVKTKSKEWGRSKGKL